MSQNDPKSFKENKLLNAKKAAAYLELNEKTLYRLIREENIPALKLGREWRFEKNLLDKWIVEKIKRASQRPEWVGDLLKELKTILSRIYGGRLRGIYLYGSAARGEMRPGSDLDIAVVLESLQNRGEEIQKISVHRAELSLRYDITISLHFMSEAEWREGQSPLIENIRREGIAA